MAQVNALTIRRAQERGRTAIGWLNSRHTFSFGQYQDARHMGYRSLRVINDDVVAPGQGFGEHGHRDMEIVTWVLDGVLEHKDSLGHTMPLRPGEVQVMSAGTGIRHSEYNASQDEPVHFLQVWLLPQRQGLPPRYEQKVIEPAKRRDRLALIASSQPRDGAVQIIQDAHVYAAMLTAGASVTHALAQHRGAWLHVARGDVTVSGQALHAGDGAAIDGPTNLTINADHASELLLFDLA